MRANSDKLSIITSDIPHLVCKVEMVVNSIH